MKKIVVEKSARRLTLLEDGRAVLTCRAALGDHPAGAKRRSGDGRTPEGDYYVCLKKAAGKFGPALGLSYPSPADGEAGGADAALLQYIRERWARRERPPWGSLLGGEIMIHGGGADRDWTRGCVALADADMAALFERVEEGTEVTLLP